MKKKKHYGEKQHHKQQPAVYWKKQKKQTFQDLWFVCYLNAEFFLGQPAAGGPPVVLRRESVGDAKLLTNSLKGLISHQS